MSAKYDREIVSDPAWIERLREMACVFTGMRSTPNESVVVMHIGNPGKGLKSDNEAWPALNRFHMLGHQKGEVAMIREYAPDWLLREMARAWCRDLHRTENGRK